MVHSKRIAWTGGDRPYSPAQYGRRRKYFISLMVEQFEDYYSFWLAWPDEQTQELFTNRALYDAHAIIRYLKERI